MLRLAACVSAGCAAVSSVVSDGCAGSLNLDHLYRNTQDVSFYDAVPTAQASDVEFADVYRTSVIVVGTAISHASTHAIATHSLVCAACNL